jgi:hypothetical protein
LSVWLLRLLLSMSETADGRLVMTNTPQRLTRVTSLLTTVLSLSPGLPVSADAAAGDVDGVGARENCPPQQLTAVWAAVGAAVGAAAGVVCNLMVDKRGKAHFCIVQPSFPTLLAPWLAPMAPNQGGEAVVAPMAPNQGSEADAAMPRVDVDVDAGDTRERVLSALSNLMTSQQLRSRLVAEARDPPPPPLSSSQGRRETPLKCFHELRKVFPHHVKARSYFNYVGLLLHIFWGL